MEGLSLGGDGGEVVIVDGLGEAFVEEVNGLTQEFVVEDFVGCGVVGVSWFFSGFSEGLS